MRISFLLILAASFLAAQDSPARVQVTSSAQATMLIESTPPVYPQIARQARIQGVVRIEVVIATDGTMKEMHLISGHPLLVAAALESLHTYKYRPTLLNGRPVEVATTVDVPFNFQGAPLSPDPMEAFTKGQTLPAAEVAQREQSPNDKTARAQRLGYYTARKQILARREMFVWFLENDPASELNQQARSMAPGNSLSDPEGYQLLKNLWLNHPRLNAQNPAVLERAGSFLALLDKPEAARIYQMLPVAADRLLGPLYAMAIIGVVGYDDNQQPVIDPSEASSSFANRARTVLVSTNSAMLAVSALPLLRAAAGSSGTYQDLIDHLQTLVPVRAMPIRPSER